MDLTGAIQRAWWNKLEKAWNSISRAIWLVQGLSAPRNMDSNILLVTFHLKSRIPPGNGPKAFPLTPYQPTNLRHFAHVIRHHGTLNLKVIDLFVWQSISRQQSTQFSVWVSLAAFSQISGKNLDQRKRSSKTGKYCSMSRKRATCTVQVSETSRSRKEANSLHAEEKRHAVSTSAPTNHSSRGLTISLVWTLTSEERERALGCFTHPGCARGSFPQVQPSMKSSLCCLSGTR